MLVYPLIAIDQESTDEPRRNSSQVRGSGNPSCLKQAGTVKLRVIRAKRHRPEYDLGTALIQTTRVNLISQR